MPLKDEENALRIVAPFIDHALNPARHVGEEASEENANAGELADQTYSGPASANLPREMNSIGYEMSMPRV